jgi:surfactin synthase thioesterase subunit/phosphopantetheinyl transferase
MPDHGRWIVRPRPNPAAEVRLLCVPHAGGGPVVFHNWPASLPASIEVCALQLPGRASRLREVPFLRMAPLVDAVMAQLGPLLDRPIAFFGHSLGALVSFQVAQRLRQTGAGTLGHMFVAACPAPHLPRLCRALHRLPDADLIEELRRLNGIPQRLINEPELLQLVLPAVRADLTVFETTSVRRSHRCRARSRRSAVSPIRKRCATISSHGQHRPGPHSNCTCWQATIFSPTPRESRCFRSSPGNSRDFPGAGAAARTRSMWRTMSGWERRYGTLRSKRPGGVVPRSRDNAQWRWPLLPANARRLGRAIIGRSGTTRARCATRWWGRRRCENPSREVGVTTSRPGRWATAVWYRHTDSIDAGDLAACNALLSDEERARCDRFVFAQDRRDFTVAHALVRSALSRYAERAPAEWRFVADRFGKPAVVAEQAGEPPLAFNLSHTKGLVACAISRGGTVGIDVERCKRDVRGRDIAARYFAAGELRQLYSCRSDQHHTRFIELWVLKESYVKAVGAGLSLDLHTCSFEFRGTSGLLFTPHDGVTGWQFWLAALQDARLAVTVRRPSPGCAPRVGFYDAGTADGSCRAALLRWSD